jgi:hypothetical protein
MTNIPPPDNPDWYRQIQFAGQILYDSGSVDVLAGQQHQFATTYVGNYPAVGIVFLAVQDVLHTFIPWGLQLTWLLAGSPYTPIEGYSGDQLCTVFDNLPVIAPDLSGIVFNNAAQTERYRLIVFASQGASRGAFVNLGGDGITGGGAYIDQGQQALAAHTNKTVYSPFLTPGMHWAYLEADFSAGAVSPTDVFCQLELSVNGAVQNIVAQSVPVDFRTIFQGMIMLPNIQPRITWKNTEAAAIQIQGHLLRARI